ncbi:MFS transporter [Streptomyces sp. NBC_01261]|uniref:MFS transporter n=1 Tax=Streptomyces sp. NBC_01261 TaxID=2903802 RepID=UPI002E36A9C3|nr:MFS transporter [Streptomyces sp. NBC_01261]
MTSTPAVVGKAPTAREVAVGAKATYAVFAGLGLAGATWSCRLPQVRAHLHLDPASLALLLLTIAVGGVVVLPLSGVVVTRVGPRRAVTGVALIVSASLGVIAVGYILSTPLLVAGLFLLGAATGFWDVAMTVHAASVERHLGRPVMSRFFAAFSLGTFAGAAVGVLMVALHVPVSVHMGAVAAAIAGTVPVAARRFLPEPSAHTGPVAPTAEAHRPGRSAWSEPRTVTVGLLALGFAVAEGAGSNWAGVSVIDRHHTTATIGTLAYTSFLAALTVGRWLGPVVLDRFGRVTALRAAAALTACGVTVFALGPSTGLAFAGTLLWGAGAALGFPVGMSAGADEPARAAGRVSVITSIGYCGFLGGPPLIGFVPNRSTIGHALLVITILMASAAALAGATRRSAGAPPQTSAGTPARSTAL